MFTLPLVGWEENQRGKVRKLVGQHKDSLIGKAKAVHASKAEGGINSPLPVGRQVFSHVWECQAPSRVMVTLGEKCHCSKHPPLPPPSLSFTCRA